MIQQKYKDKFWSKVNKTDECWLWTGYKNHDGYGIHFADKKHLAHRFSLLLGDYNLVGLEVCHKCDNPSCVRPEHLFVGTHSDNMHDMKLKQRQAQGSRIGVAKLNETIVADIRQDCMYAMRNNRFIRGELVALAKKYNVSKDTIARIARRERWQHI